VSGSDEVTSYRRETSGIYPHILGIFSNINLHISKLKNTCKGRNLANTEMWFLSRKFWGGWVLDQDTTEVHRGHCRRQVLPTQKCSYFEKCEGFDDYKILSQNISFVLVLITKSVKGLKCRKSIQRNHFGRSGSKFYLSTSLHRQSLYIPNRRKNRKFGTPFFLG